MLDSFLKVAFANEEKVAEQARIVDKMRALPEDYLRKLASGQEKLAYSSLCGDFGGGGETWLDRFKGTPLFEQALELEKQDLQEQMAEKARYREEDQARSMRNASRDEISIQRKLLELQLAEAEGGVGEPPPEEEMGQEGLPPEGEMAPEEAPAEAVPPPAEMVPPQAAMAPSPAEAAPPRPSVDVKVASAMMRMTMLALGKEAAVADKAKDLVKKLLPTHVRGAGSTVTNALGMASKPHGVGSAMGGSEAWRKLLEGKVALASIQKTAAVQQVEQEKSAAALRRLGFNKLAAMPKGRPMNAYEARERLRGDISGAVDQYGVDPHEVHGAIPMMQDWLRERQGGLQEAADKATAHPVMHRIKGAIPPALSGGILGGFAGRALSGTSRGAALGGLVGAAGMGALGALGTRSPQSLADEASEYQAAMNAVDLPMALEHEARRRMMMQDAQRELALHRRAVAVAEAGATKNNTSTNLHNYSSSSGGGRDDDGRDDDDDFNLRSKRAAMEARFVKTAIGLGMLGKTLGAAGKSVFGAGQQAAKAVGTGGLGAAKAGVQGAWGQAGKVLPTVGRAAKSYVKANPMQAAAGAGAVGLGTGYAMS